ncbi:hypothetical protein ACJX0J_019640, partial [Zea mays]
SGAGNPGALGDHRRVPGRLPAAVHHQAPRRSPQLPPVLRGHWPWRLHCSGRVQGEGGRGHGGLLLAHRSRGHRAGHRHRFRLQQARRHRPGRGGRLQRGRRRDPGVHVPGRSPRRGLQQPEAADERQAPAGGVRRPVPRRGAHVVARQMGVEQNRFATRQFFFSAESPSARISVRRGSEERRPGCD